MATYILSLYFSEADIKWKTCVERFQMMPDPHTDGGAEEFFTISKKHVRLKVQHSLVISKAFSFYWCTIACYMQLLFQMQCDLNNIIALRFILRQPSPMWKDYKLDDIICYKTSASAPADITLPTWMTEGSKRQIGQLKVCFTVQLGLCNMKPNVLLEIHVVHNT